jgi:hypothetical protein
MVQDIARWDMLMIGNDNTAIWYGKDSTAQCLALQCRHYMCDIFQSVGLRSFLLLQNVQGLKHR